MVTGIAPTYKEPRKEGAKYIKFKPLDVKEDFQRRHLRDQFDSMQGPTHDKVNLCLRPFDHDNKTTAKEYD